MRLSPALKALASPHSPSRRHAAETTVEAGARLATAMAQRVCACAGSYQLRGGQTYHGADRYQVPFAYESSSYARADQSQGIGGQLPPPILLSDSLSPVKMIGVPERRACKQLRSQTHAEACALGAP